MIKSSFEPSPEWSKEDRLNVIYSLTDSVLVSADDGSFSPAIAFEFVERVRAICSMDSESLERARSIILYGQESKQVDS